MELPAPDDAGAGAAGWGAQGQQAVLQEQLGQEVSIEMDVLFLCMPIILEPVMVR